MNESIKPATKQPWQRPTLEVYGSIGKLTNNLGMTNGASDGSGGASSKKTLP